MSKVHRPIVIIGLIGVCFVAVIAAGGFMLADRYLRNFGQSSVGATCPRRGTSYTVTIRDGQAQPTHTIAELCGTLTIVNADDRLRLVAFGEHDDHTAYDGITERALLQGQSLTIVLDQAGTFTFHDHIDDTAVGYFTVESAAASRHPISQQRL